MFRSGITLNFLTMFKSHTNHLGFRIQLTLTTVILLSAIGVGMIWYNSSERAITQAIEGFYRQSNDVVKDHLDEFFNNVRLIYKQQELMSDELDAIVQDRTKMQQYLTDSLVQHPNIEHFYFATPEGGFRLIGRDPDIVRFKLPESYANYLEFIETERPEASALHRYIIHPEKQNILLNTKEYYDARKQPWFFQALTHDQAVWSELIKREEQQGELGVTLSKAEYDQAGELLGVWGMDIDLTPLIDELESIKISPNSVITILGRQGTILTSTRPDHVAAYGELKTIDPQQTPLLYKVWKYRYGHTTEVSPVYRFHCQGQDWLSYTGYYTLDGDDRVTIVMLSPLSDFTSVFMTAKDTAIILTLVLMIIAAIYGYYGNRYILTPIQRLTHAINNISKGHWGQTLNLKRNDEVGQLADAFDDMSRHLEQTITHLDQEREETARLNLLLEKQNQELEARVAARTLALKEANSRLEKLAFYDPLTNAPNRRYFWQRFNEMRDRQGCWLMLLDVDNFKKLNDTYGHQVGDQALQHLVNICNDTFDEPDFIGRIGGEEFAICSLAPDESTIRRIADDLLKRIASIPVSLGDTLITITVSMGITQCEPGSKGCFGIADGLLYQAKQSGKNKALMMNLQERG
ncbi:hypothetical protein PSSHI_27120 [Photobacterium sp. R1]